MFTLLTVLCMFGRLAHSRTLRTANPTVPLQNGMVYTTVQNGGNGSELPV